MSQTSASGSGGAATPGWYTDPHDPRQLRWWSGEGWTEHVSPGSGDAQAAQQAAAAAAAAQAQAGPVQATDPSAPLPSRRALRDPATEASEAAESALAAQAAQQQAAQQQQATQQAAYDAQQQAAQQQAAQQHATQQQQSAQAPVAAQQPSAPVPTLPVAPTSFLEQQGYAPLDGAPADPNGWGQPAQTLPPVQAFEPGQAFPPAALGQPAAAVQPAAVQPAAVQPPQSLPPVETAQPNAWNQPVQAAQPAQAAEPAQPNAWNQPLQPTQLANPASSAQPNAWNQPVQPTQPEQQGWGAPAAAGDGIDSLFGGGANGQPSAADGQSGQWGLSPSDGATETRRRGAEPDAVAGSSSFWAWLIAISPILAAGSIVYVLLAVKPALTAWPFEAAVAAPYLLVLLFALADRAVLLQLGHTQPRSPAWALLSAPIYLIVRASETRREDGSGTALTLVWFVSFLVAIGGIVGYGFLTHHALIAGLPT